MSSSKSNALVALFGLLVFLLLVGACTPETRQMKARSLDQFRISERTPECYDRRTQPSTAVTDLHLHAQPFGGLSIPYNELVQYLDENDVRFALLYGIGQTLPYDHECTYYLDCPAIPVLPSMRNDFENAANFLENPQNDVDVRLSMSFLDLAHPGKIIERIRLLDEEYPGLFVWAGEVNLNKLALLNNGHVPVSAEQISGWGPFMLLLEKRGVPLAIHSDLGHDSQPQLYLSLMQTVLDLYPRNKIVWMHMGLSRELTKMNPETHITVMSAMLNKYPNLYLDISWTVLAQNYFNTPSRRAIYANFFNSHHTRILAGTDFVASRSKDGATYRQEAQTTSAILADLNDDAFRAIALGQNYFDLVPGLSDEFAAPQICSSMRAEFTR